jgi:nucleoside-diphosphate-sugar epimerase
MTTPNASEQGTPQTALITGATGFIGGHLVRHLARLGWKVHALARQVSTDQEIAKAAIWHSSDGDYESVSRAVASSEADVVFHLASLFLSEHKPDHIDALVDANLRFGMHLLEAMHQHNVRRLINTGTSWQHYNNADYDPVNLYAATKQAFEAIIDYYCNAHKLSAITLKLYDTYGSNDKRKKIINVLINAITEKLELDLTDGTSQLNIVHVNDVCNALRVAATQTRCNDSKHLRFGVGGTDKLSILEIASIIQEKMGQTGQFNWGTKQSLTRTPAVPPELPLLPKWNPKTNLSQIDLTTMEKSISFKCPGNFADKKSLG